jgi:hypothetical protein
VLAVVIVLSVVSVLVAVLISLCGVGVIPRNPWAGLRIPSLFASDAAWVAGHRAAIVPMVCAAVVNIVLAVLAATMFSSAAESSGEITLVIVALVVLVLGTVIGAVSGVRAANRVEA